ncbi:MAG TPA: hypothetical protein VFK89_05765 [Actinomycetota bacterium]|nr:hypothetical protein [Actinomycetota bacterium]
MSASEKITAEELLDTMAEADVLETFIQLPKADQEKFSDWIGRARNNESHWRRINVLVMALKTGPFQPSAPSNPGEISR